MNLRDGVTAFVIVRNEYDNIGLCLSSLYNQVDEVLLIDDGSDEKRDELIQQYRYWASVLNKSGTYMQFVMEPHKGFHHRHFDLVSEIVQTKWMFGLDGDEILRPDAHRFTLRHNISTLHSESASSVGCMMHEYADFAGDMVLERSYPKYRLFRKDMGHFNNVEHGEWQVDRGIQTFSTLFHIDHIRTKDEKSQDAQRYKKEVVLQYKLATTDEKRKYFADLYKSQAEYYGWTEKEIGGIL